MNCLLLVDKFKDAAFFSCIPTIPPSKNVAGAARPLPVSQKRSLELIHSFPLSRSASAHRVRPINDHRHLVRPSLMRYNHPLSSIRLRSEMPRTLCDVISFVFFARVLLSCIPPRFISCPILHLQPVSVKNTLIFVFDV